MVKVGIIGGSGLDDPEIIADAFEQDVDTEYGKLSSPLVIGEIGGVSVVIIARHGKRHQHMPSDVNYRANIAALKAEGVTHIIATTACGSLVEEIDRGHLVILDQFIDFTKNRISTFVKSFEDGAVHPSMAKPFDEDLRELLIKTSQELNFKYHKSGTVVTIEGPRFSTISESKMFKAWGADVINMSVSTEAALANEAGIPYAAIAMSTDYDCWKEDEEPVSWDEILKIFNENADKVKKLLVSAIPKLKK